MTAATDYPAMFKAYLDLEPNDADKIDEAIAWAKRVLKKDNRIVWWLKWFRLFWLDHRVGRLRKYTPNGMNAEQHVKQFDQVKALLAQYTREMNAKLQNGGTVDQGLEQLGGTLTQKKQQLEHFYALPDRAIQEIDPSPWTPGDFFAQLYELERNFIEQTKGTLVPKPEDSIFLQCDANWAWWLLPRASCADEAKAMGHCGNSPDSDRDMSILSLREKKDSRKGEVRWEPHCTFILHRIGEGPDVGTLGEMKGKGNAKPVARYHPYIIKLLEDPRIKGIDGGGYLPEHNFSAKDLTKEQRDAIREKNPVSMLSLKRYHEENGFDDVCTARVAAKLGIANDTCDEGFVLRRWKNYDALIDDCGNSEAKDLQALISQGNLEVLADKLLDNVDEDDPIFNILAEYIEQMDPTFDIHSEPLAERVVAYVRAATGVSEDVPLRQGLEEALLEGYIAANPLSARDYDSLGDIITQTMDDSLSDGSSSNGSDIGYDAGDIVQYIDWELALEAALRGGEVSENAPYPSVDMRINEDTALQALYDNFKSGFYTQKTLEEKGQSRLFKRPASDEEAKREGIKVSKLAALPPERVTILNQKLKDQHALNQRLDDHLETKKCPGCGEIFYANRNDGDYCCYGCGDGHWHGAPEGAGAERTASVVTAAVNYDEFFQTLLKLSPDITSWVGSEIAWAKRVLKKQNRIVWWLRWARYACAATAAMRYAAAPTAAERTGPHQKEVQAYADKLKKELQSRGAKVEPMDGRLTFITNMHQSFAHMYGLSVQAIQDLDPGFANPADVLAQMEKLEEAWKAEEKSLLDPHSEDSIFIDLGGDWAWWLLPRASCADEAKAMGHCGNSPAARRTDRSILSLRQKKTVGGKDRWEPHCTFILHTDGDVPDEGTLGEMKGKGNAKPVARYHPAIMKLLEDHRIKGVLGGGYLPSHNFSFEDLTEEQQKEVRAANPDAYFSFREYVDSGEADFEALAVGLGLTGDTEEVNGNTVYTVSGPQEMDEFIRYYGEKSTEEIAACVDGSMKFFVEYLLDRIDPFVPTFAAIARQINEDFPQEDLDPDADRVLDDVKAVLNDLNDWGEESPTRSGLEKAFLAGIGGWRTRDGVGRWRKVTTLKEMLHEAILKSVDMDLDGEETNVAIVHGDQVCTYLTQERVLELAQKYQGDDEKPEWAYPHVMTFDADDEKLSDPNDALNVLMTEFRVVELNPRMKEEAGQGRLFDRPKTDAEAKKHGIKHSSWLLKPKQAASDEEERAAAMKHPDQNEFLKEHYTGSIPSNAYTGKGMFDWQKLEKYPKLLKRVTLKDGTEVDLRQEGTKNRYARSDKDGYALRDENDHVVYMTDAEIKQKKLPEYDTAIFAFNDAGECVAQASDEWGADLVSVREDYQKKGLGLQLLTEFRRQFPKVRQMGQMSGAGRELAKSYYRSLTGNEPVPEYDPDEDPDYLARRAVWRFLANIDYAKADLMTEEQAEKIKEFDKAGEKDKDPHALLQRVRDWVLQQGAGATFITPASKRALDPMAAKQASTVPPTVIARAETMLEDVKPEIAGDVERLDGYTIETHTLGCRNQANEAEDTWWAGLWEFFDRYDTDGISTVLGDPTDGKFVTITPDKTAKQAAKVKGLPKLLYHGTPTANVKKILKQGLLPEMSKSGSQAVYLTDDHYTAVNYEGMHDSVPFTVLQVDTKYLDPAKLIADDYELPELWEDIPARVRSQFGDDWRDATWEVSLKYTNQVAYEGAIPAAALSAAPEVDYGTAKQASPDFGYTQFNDREKDLRHVKITVEGDLEEFGVVAKFNGKDVGVMYCVDEFSYSPAGKSRGGVGTGSGVSQVEINEAWRGTGLGQLLYDKAIEKAKALGADWFASDTQLTPDAVNAWRRLGKRYPMREVPNSETPLDGAGHPIYVIDLKPLKKTAYISMKQAELTVIMDLGNQPRATITLDLGIPNFTVFSIRIPIDGIPIETIVGYVESAFEALLDDIAAFMLTMKYPEEEVVSIEEDARKCFHAINFKDASDADMSDKDAFIRMYEGHFELSPEFVDKTQGKVVTAKVVKRDPPVRRLELQRMDPNLRNNKPARIIQLYRNRSLRSQPRPHYVLVYDQRGRGVGAVPLARNWESRLLIR